MKLNIKKYVDDNTLSWEERYKKLEAHHIEETTELLKQIKYLEEELCEVNDTKGECDSWCGDDFGLIKFFRD